MNSRPQLQASILIIAGITGNLARKYLLPSLYDLITNGAIPENFKIVGLSRADITNADIIQIVEENLQKKGQIPDQTSLEKMKNMLEICIMNISDPADYKILRKRLDEIEDETGVCMHRLYYMAIPPQIFGPVIDSLGTYGLNAGCQHGKTESRLLLEKPFGYDLASARELIERVNISFDEKHIYRVDHYLAKENAQNILTFRFDNPLFAHIWDKKFIENITIIGSETIGIEMRANFYEQTGALRDFIQSHLLQLLSLATMKEPASESYEDLHKSKLELLRSIVPIAPDEVQTRTARGQYAGYAQEVERPHTKTETFAALVLSIDNDQWRGVPILLKTGKALNKRTTEINFKFRNLPGKNHPVSSLKIRVQSDEGITLGIVAKKPGFSDEKETVVMRFSYDQHFNGALPNAYEYVLVDALRGDQSLFPAAEEIIRSWEIVENIIQAWARDPSSPEIYKPGSDGPESAKKLAKEHAIVAETTD